MSDLSFLFGQITNPVHLEPTVSGRRHTLEDEPIDALTGEDLYREAMAGKGWMRTIDIAQAIDKSRQTTLYSLTHTYLPRGLVEQGPNEIEKGDGYTKTHSVFRWVEDREPQEAESIFASSIHQIMVGRPGGVKDGRSSRQKKDKRKELAERYAEVLRPVMEGKGPMRTADIAKATGMNKATVRSRFERTMLPQGYVVRCHPEKSVTRTSSGGFCGAVTHLTFKWVYE